MTDAPRCDRTVDTLGVIPCNHALPCPHHPTNETVRARIDALKAQLKEAR